jgi:beta-galactosidase
MFRTNIDRAWEFQLGTPSTIPGYGKPTRTVNLPHDFMIESDVSPDAPGKQESGYFCGGIGTYTKMLDIPAEDSGKRYVLEFDGSYMRTTVGVNGHTIARHYNGYTPFHVDVTRFLKFGQKNRLEVIIDNEAQPSGRWYTGSGLYRHVDLLSSGKINIAPWGIYAYTDHIASGVASVVIETTVENHTAEDADLWVKISFDGDKNGQLAAGDKIKVHVPACERRIARIRIAIPNAKIWDIDEPNLYVINAELTDGESVLDTDSTLFGIRTISVDAVNGFMLNGRSIKLKGGCVHHDNGILGAKSFYDAEYRRMKIHKDNGYNAIRFSHNSMSRDLLEACDRLGLLVIDEAFDVWTIAKTTHDYANYFAENWEQDLKDFIMRDRNHPCVIMWSIGNEIPERGGLSDGAEWSQKLSSVVRELDSTRFITGALCSFFNGLDDYDKEKFWKALYAEAQNSLGGGVLNLDNSFGKSIFNSYTEGFAAPLDIVGYNYL